MADRKPFLLRIDREVIDALQRWADDDLRSLNGHIEFLLRRALRESGRLAGSQQRGGTEDSVKGSSNADKGSLDTDKGSAKRTKGEGG